MRALVLAQAERRRFSAEYKRKILQEADACTKPGEFGALLRRERLYSSILAGWRAARRRDGREGLAEKKRDRRRECLTPETRRSLRCRVTAPD